MSHTIPSPHDFLAQLAGQWHGTSRLWLEPGNLADEAPITGNIQLILDGRFARFEYQSSILGNAQKGSFTFGYNALLARYEACWMDSFHNETAIMFCAGRAKGNGFFVTGSYSDPKGGPDWNWRTEVTFNESELIIAAFNIRPDGVEAKATEALLQKVNT